ncbi:hypothetical protein [Nocardia asteroides]
MTEPEHLTFGRYVHLLQSPTSWRKLATDPLSAGQEAAVHWLLQVLRTAEPNP